MSCTETITISQLTVDTPLHTATYVPATDKILGTSQNYILEFNATTGALERSSKFVSPAYGNMHIGWIAGSVCVAVNNDPSVGTSTSSTHVRRDIFPLNTTTLEAGAGLGLPAVAHSSIAYTWYHGPHQFISVGTNVYVLFPLKDYVALDGFDATNVAGTYVSNKRANYGFWTEQICTNGVNTVYSADPGTPSVNSYDLSLTAGDYIDTTPHRPVGCEYAAGKVYAVCGDSELLRMDNFGAGTFTVFTMGAGKKPIRLRYNAYDGLLYIPCPYSDTVMVFNPATEAITVVSGFASPIDVVFTPTKAWAVQSSSTGLREVA